MIGLARLSIRRPLPALLAWTALALVLSAIGLGATHALSPSVVIVPGSESSRAQHLAESRFGPTQLVPILLEGPALALERQGPTLVRDLAHRPHTRVLSAWDTGPASAGLRPSATAAMIVVSVDRPEAQVVNSDQPQIERLVARDLSPAVHASVTGQPAIDRALRDQALSTTRRSELIAVAILFVLLLLGLRAPLAAGLVALLGAGTVLSGFGVMAIVGRLIATDPVAVALASMTGLALGVGYSLLILDRFHQRVAGPAGSPGGGSAAPDAAAAASEAVASTGRAVLFSGTGLILALLLATAIAPTKILASLGVGVLVCSALAVGAAVVVMPAALVLLGRDVAAGHTAPHGLARDWDRLVGAGAWVRRYAVVAGAVATAALLALAAPALSLKTGPPDVKQLPPHDPARVAFERVAHVMGPGWPTPYNMIVVNPHGPITTAAMLASLDQLQSRIARGRAVAAVTGPGLLSTQTKPLGKLPQALRESSKLLTGGKSDLKRLEAGLGQAGAGAKELQSGLASASSGASQLHSGSGSAQSGAGQLHAGLVAARSGSATLSNGLQQALSGARALKSGASQALAGSVQLANGLSTVNAPATQAVPSLKQLQSSTAAMSSSVQSLQGRAQSGAGDLASALGALQGMTAGKSDPRYEEALAALQRAGGAVGEVAGGLGSLAPDARAAADNAATVATQGSFLSSALGELNKGATQLQNGLAKLHSGNAELAAGIDKLAGGGGELTGGLTQLRDGAGELETGLSQLTNGTGELQSGLAGGVAPTGQLVNGLGLMQSSVAKFSGQLPSPKDLEELQKQSPGLFNSGYFLLAAVAGATSSNANAASFTVNVARGGDAAQIVVISRYPSADSRTARMGDRLDSLARSFASANHVSVAVGGPAGNLADFTSATNARLPWVIAALALAIALVLGIALRAVLLPLVAVAFNLLTAAAAFGALRLLFVGSHPVLGGPGYLDPMSIVGIFAVVFGISLVYLVVLLVRTREHLLAGASASDALDRALRGTAAATTGSGLLMIAALIPFATTELITVRAFGVGVAVALALDVFLVRPVLLPAAVAVLGRRSWWPTCRQLRSPDQQPTPMKWLHRKRTVGGAHS